eukprot:7952508-Prorocentrum_lima.AAC.1
MTSSLVGSEMCIRDRVLAHCRAQLAAARNERDEVQRQLDAVRRERDRPVSYTHLTLPTICSV